MNEVVITAQDERDLKNSWGKEWRKHCDGKKQVVEKCNALLAKMKSKGWKPHIHENLGWHYCLENLDGHLTLNESNGQYYCLLSEGDFKHSGSPLWHSEKCFNDPNKAVEAQIKMARNKVDELDKIIKQAETILTQA